MRVEWDKSACGMIFSTLAISRAVTFTQHGWPTNLPSSAAFSMPPARTTSLVTTTLLFRFQGPTSSVEGTTWTHTFLLIYV